MSDFILTNTDRHFNNIGVLVNSDTMTIEKMAPIFDSGKSLFIDQHNILDIKELLSIKTNSFAKDEITMLKKYVQNRDLIDVSKIPEAAFIKEVYEKDDKINKKYISRICDAYEKKIELFRDFQLGKDLNRIKISLCKKETPDIDDF